MELSELQLAIMRVLWDRGEASAADVQAALKRDLAITTVSTLLSRLEKRDAVAHRSEGRTFLYRATISEGSVRKSMLSGLVRTLFRGDPSEVVSHLLSARDVSHDDVRRIRELVAEAPAPRKRSRRGR